MDETTQLLLFIAYLFFEKKKQWEDFEEEIKYNNRFFPECELLDDIKRIQNYAVWEIKEGDVFYRARPANSFSDYSRETLEELNNIIKKYYPTLLKEDSFFDFSNSLEMIRFLIALLKAQQDNLPFLDEIEQICNKNKSFWGYSVEGSDAPPREKATAGRANPEGISYLYLAEDVKTVLMEVRPNLSQDISVATIKIKKKLRLFDFCYVEPNEAEKGKGFDLGIISSEFSKPNYGGGDNYYATQYLCEFIKKLGFDGIRFYSSVNPGRKNIVLFDSKIDPVTNCKNYEIVESKIYSITKLDLDYTQALPVKE